MRDDDNAGEAVAIGCEDVDVRGALYTLCCERGWRWSAYTRASNFMAIYIPHEGAGSLEIDRSTVVRGALSCWVVRPVLHERYGDDALQRAAEGWPATLAAANEVRAHLRSMTDPDADKIASVAWARILAIASREFDRLIAYQPAKVRWALAGIVDRLADEHGHIARSHHADIVVDPSPVRPVHGYEEMPF